MADDLTTHADRTPERPVPEGRVRVRLLPAMGSRPFFAFDLSEADLSSRARATGGRTRTGTIAHHAAETAWSMTHIAARDGAFETANLPPEYEAQIMAYRASGEPGLSVRERVEVARSSGARSVWRLTADGWDLIDRRPAALEAAVAERRAQRERQAHSAGAARPAPTAAPQLRRQPECRR